MFEKQMPLFAGFLLFGLNVQAADPHVHGLANLLIAQEGEEVVVELKTPSDNVLGFEYEPKSKAEKALYADVVERLEDPANVVTLDGSCKLESVDVDAPYGHGHDDHKEHDDHDHNKGHEHHDEHHEHEGHDHDEGTHSDFSVTYHFHCESLKGAEVTAFDSFNRFETIEVNWALEAGQGSKKAQKNKQTLSF